jgi:ketosteroid isomerase-like protein
VHRKPAFFAPVHRGLATLAAGLPLLSNARNLATVSAGQRRTEALMKIHERFLDAHARGDVEAISKLLSEDVQWQLPRSAGVGPFRGVEEVSRALAGMAAGNWLDVSTISRDVRNIVIDGELAVALELKTARSHSGAEYVNEYCWVYTCRDGLISEIHNYTDTLYAFRLFGLANGA